MNRLPPSIDYSSLVVSIVLIAHAFLISLTALGCRNMMYTELNQSSEGSKSLPIIEREGRTDGRLDRFEWEEDHHLSRRGWRPL